MGDVPVGDFSIHDVWSGNNILGDADDVVVAGSLQSVNGISAGATLRHSDTVILERGLLNAHALAADVSGQAAGTISQDVSPLFFVIDPLNELNETDKTNNRGQGRFTDSDDITYFPWDADANGQVTPTDGLAAIRSVNTSDIPFDFDGNGIVTPREAMAVLQRLGYRRRAATIESSPSSSSTIESAPVTAPVFAQLNEEDIESDLFAADHADESSPSYQAASDDNSAAIDQHSLTCLNRLCLLADKLASSRATWRDDATASLRRLAHRKHVGTTVLHCFRERLQGKGLRRLHNLSIGRKITVSVSWIDPSIQRRIAERSTTLIDLPMFTEISNKRSNLARLLPQAAACQTPSQGYEDR